MKTRIVELFIGASQLKVEYYLTLIMKLEIFRRKMEAFDTTWSDSAQKIVRTRLKFLIAFCCICTSMMKSSVRISELTVQIALSSIRVN